DDDLLRYLDGAMSDDERAQLEERLARSPYASARIAIVADALTECGWPAPKAEPVGRRAVSLAARYVFQLSQGVLTFLRGTDVPVGLQPAMAVRSTSSAEQTSFFEFVQRYDSDAGAIDARLAIEPVKARGLDVQLEVTHAGAPLDGVRIKL